MYVCMCVILVAVVGFVVRVWMRHSPLLVAVNEVRQQTRLLRSVNEPVFQKLFRRRTLHVQAIIITSNIINPSID